MAARVGSLVGRERSMVTLEKKLEIIDELAKGKSQRYILNMYDVPKSTIDDIWRDKEKMCL